MIQQYILQYLTEAINAIQDPLLPQNKTIVYPNEFVSIEALDNELYFEVYCGGLAPQYETENSTTSNVVGTIVISGKTNVGSSLLDAVSEALIYNFLPTNPLRKIGFSTRNPYDNHISNVYVSSVERTETGIDDGRYKVSIFITFDVYEG